MTQQVWWYATRAAGLMTWSTAVAAVLVGVLLSDRLLGNRPSGTGLVDAHRFLGGLSVAFLAIHLGALWADSVGDFGWREMILPEQSTWRTGAITWGVAAGWTLVAVELTSLLRRWLRSSLWRVVHAAGLVTVGAGTAHALGAGTDVDDPAVWSFAGASSLIVVLFVVTRATRRASEPSRSEREEVLVEMRQRLADLPMPDTMPQPELDNIAGGPLPRRAPVLDGSATVAGGMPQPTKPDDDPTLGRRPTADAASNAPMNILLRRLSETTSALGHGSSPPEPPEAAAPDPFSEPDEGPPGRERAPAGPSGAQEDSFVRSLTEMITDTDESRVTGLDIEEPPPPTPPPISRLAAPPAPPPPTPPSDPPPP
ncbi:MAG: hypothetical protein ACE5GB_15630, partial [Acidimicrobiales bacterium]